jgi:hypothetical protein
LLEQLPLFMHPYFELSVELKKNKNRYLEAFASEARFKQIQHALVQKLMYLRWVYRNHFMQIRLKRDSSIPKTSRM